MKLLIGNKNYSSWSMRPWLVLTHFDIAFNEELLLLNGPRWKERLLDASPTGRVPLLVDGDLKIWESLAIIEYLADRFPDRAIWPRDPGERALARAASAEMHSGFAGLRAAAPVNLRASYPGRVPLDSVADDLHRLEELWGDFLASSGGPYLFGTFCAADAMFAPVASRLRTYDLPTSDTVAEYVEAIHALPAFQAWLSGALAEPWIVEEDELPPTGNGTCPTS